MSSSTRGNKAFTSSNRGNHNRRYGNKQDKRGGNENSSGNNAGAKFNTRGAHQQRASSGNIFTPADIDSQKHMHDRVTYLLAKSIGCNAIVTVATGARYSGILTAATTANDIGVVLELAHKYASAPGEEDEAELSREKFDKIVFQSKDLVDIAVDSPDLRVQKSAATTASAAVGFKTDTDISGQKGMIKERELQRWSADENSTLGLSLEESVNSSQPWDQFAVNQNKFGVQSTYDEHLYTTVIDRSHPEFQARSQRAEQIAGEILKSSYNGNIHLAEERGVQVDDSGMDEEDKYSGVDRRSSKAEFSAAGSPVISLPRNPNKYTPPALRQSAKPHNVHLDPAIISSSMVASNGQEVPKAALPDSDASTSHVSGGTSTSISELFNASMGVTEPESGSISATSDSTSSKPTLPSVALPASSRNGKLNAEKDKASTKTPSNTEGIQKGLAGDFKEFVTTEVEKVQQKKQFLQHKEKSDRIHDFKKFSQGYKIKTPVPIDLVPILGKKPDSVSSSPSNSAGSTITSSSSKSVIQPALPTMKSESSALPLSAKIAQSHESSTPPQVPSPLPATKNVRPVQPSASPLPTTAQPTASPAATSKSNTPKPSEKKLNLNFKAPEFRPNPAAMSFTPSFAMNASASSSSHASPSITHSQTANTPRQNRPGNSFYGNKVLSSKTIGAKFNPFQHAQETFQGNEPFHIEKAFVTPPTWTFPEEKSYVEFLPVNMTQASFYSQQGVMGMPTMSPGLGGDINMVPQMQPVFDDPRIHNMMGTSSPPMHAQVQFIPGMNYSQYMSGPQYFGRAPQPFPIPNMMGQPNYMSFNPQQGYQSPRGPQAIIVPPINPQGFNMNGNGFYSPHQHHQHPYPRGGNGSGN